MKRTLSAILCLMLGFTMFGCAGGTTDSSKSTQGDPTGTTAAPQPTGPSQEAMDALNGKKILFIGNSYTHRGNAVIHKGYDVLTQQERSNDQGYFYQICKANGIDVSVTNWCFGSHSITDTFAEACTCASTPCKGVNHPSYLTDRYFDYVAIQCFTEKQYESDLASYLKPVTDLFRQENPNVKFLLLVPHMAYDKGYSWVQDVEAMADAGFIVCNWGGMLQDIVKKNVKVPGAKQPYGRPTFVVSVSETDGHHQNILAGYLTALMVYCAITGESAVGQSYAFCGDSTINPKFDLDAFKAAYYTFEPYTNFIEVFQSEPDMNGLQQLVDRYIEKFN